MDVIECLSENIQTHIHALFIKINSWWHFNSYLCSFFKGFYFAHSLGRKNDDGLKKGSVTGCVFYNKHCHRVVRVSRYNGDALRWWWGITIKNESQYRLCKSLYGWCRQKLNKTFFREKEDIISRGWCYAGVKIENNSSVLNQQNIKQP